MQDGTISKQTVNHVHHGHMGGRTFYQQTHFCRTISWVHTAEYGVGNANSKISNCKRLTHPAKIVVVRLAGESVNIDELHCSFGAPKNGDLPRHETNKMEQLGRRFGMELQRRRNPKNIQHHLVQRSFVRRCVEILFRTMRLERADVANPSSPSRGGCISRLVAIRLPIRVLHHQRHVRVPINIPIPVRAGRLRTIRGGCDAGEGAVLQVIQPHQVILMCRRVFTNQKLVVFRDHGYVVRVGNTIQVARVAVGVRRDGRPTK
mmetsp:Transcript_103856/g.178924  ORF Transcript_103856/g.178924 Transcript_103856/m.178924 type:complete len:262 (+) Transcript_103856:2154-2939(+)